MLEVELRGKMSKAEYAAVRAKLNKRAQGHRNDKRSQFFEYPKGILKISELRRTGKTILSLKLGDETKNCLDEFELELAQGMFDNTIGLLEALGSKKRELVEQRRIDYQIDGICVSLKFTADWGYHFEVEKLVDPVKLTEERARQELISFCREFDLHPLSTQELTAFLARIKH